MLIAKDQGRQEGVKDHKQNELRAVLGLIVLVLVSAAERRKLLSKGNLGPNSRKKCSLEQPEAFCKSAFSMVRKLDLWNRRGAKF
jgi:hypothetical protein